MCPFKDMRDSLGYNFVCWDGRSNIDKGSQIIFGKVVRQMFHSNTAFDLVILVAFITEVM